MAKLQSEDGGKVMAIQKPYFEKLAFQIRLLLWKRWKERTKSKYDLFKVIFPAMLFFSLLLLVYAVFDGLFHPDGCEAFIAPFAFWIFMQRLLVQIMQEKSTRLQESMRMMGLLDVAYYASYLIADGVILGFGLSMICCLFSTGGLFNNANFGELLGIFFVFCLSAVPFCFFIAAFFDTPQTSGQALLGILLGLYIIYVIVFLTNEPGILIMSYTSAQTLACLVPPLALQIACGAFLRSYVGISVHQICNLMVADIFLYSFLAWYVAQIKPSKVGVSKPWYFLFQKSYWMPEAALRELADKEGQGQMDISTTTMNKLQQTLHDTQQQASLEAGQIATNAADTALPPGTIPEESVNESLQGFPSVVVKKLKKTFNTGQVAVNDLSFKMYANQIFALLGHNGAGKTTTISMLTGLIAPDLSLNQENGAFIYGKSILKDMESIRYSMGVCPQHDVLFDNLSVREHILFFAQLKGFSYADAEVEAVKLTDLFHLGQRLDHRGCELSGGQKRKLSVAIAVCGGSEFVVLDEPTAGMDPLARRELWDLLANLRQGRTMLLTTHYMDEADVLGDRVGIMSHGIMQCIGSTQFLKTTYGAGYKLIFDKDPNQAANPFTNDKLYTLTKLVQQYIPEAVYLDNQDGYEMQVLYNLPFHAVSKFGEFFSQLESVIGTGKGLEKSLAKGLEKGGKGSQGSSSLGSHCSLSSSTLGVINFGVNITSLEDVFLKVGEDHSVKANEDVVKAGEEASKAAAAAMAGGKGGEGGEGIGATKEFNVNLISQIIGLMKRKLSYAMNDFITFPLLLLPIGTAIAAAIIYAQQVISNANQINDLVISGMYLGAYLGAPGLLAEFLVRERTDKLRNVLTVMGCDFRAYWIGTFLADYALMMIPTIIFWIIWPAAGMTDFTQGKQGLCFFLLILFNFQMIAYSYFFSRIFTEPKSCISLMPIIIIIMIVSPIVLLMILVELSISTGTSVPNDVISGILIWGIMITTPHGALWSALLDTTQNYSAYISNYPSVGAIIAFQIIEGILYLGYSYYTDTLSIAVLTREPDETMQSNPELMKSLSELDEDVLAEREKVAGLMTQPKKGDHPLVIDRLRKVFPPKQVGHRGVVATEDVSFSVESGEIFGLLGANGAGKTTTLSMLTRHLIPSAGDAFIANQSILSSFSQGSTHLGVVTQNNSLWDRLSVEAHLKLFARLRGVPENLVKSIVDGTIDQLELSPHRYKLAQSLSGGMKRKLCVAIALIGDPEVVLLDEPSAGLDPVSRRNLWTVILRTMSHRAVILTTHSMEEAEALCRRIGIMVKGQIRCLGTKQHLKNKFGSGFELSVKLQLNNSLTSAEVHTRTEALHAFVKQSFPSSAILSENAGLFTYQIPKEEMQMGRAFSLLEKEKNPLHIEDYTIAQPTLEQVFIRTVNKYTYVNKDDLMLGDVNAEIGAEGYAPGIDDVVLDRNKCGCTNRCTKIMVAVAIVFVVAFIGGGLGSGYTDPKLSAFLWLVGVISLIVAITGCTILCCACCQNPKDEEG